MSTKKAQAVPPALKKKMPPPPEDEEDEEIDLDEEDEDLDDDMDMGVDILTSLLATEEGDTLATTLVNLNDSVERIATSLELQNKIMVKMLAALKTAGCQCPKPEPIVETQEEEDEA
jgi:hypothetical protein